MKYESRVTCFLDILGFQKHINDSVKDKSGEKEIDKISDALMCIRDVLDIDRDKTQESKVVTQFSDCIVISFCDKEESGVFWMLLEIQWLLMNLVSRGFICRGGISHGKLIHNEKLVFGPALVEAYKMESEAALYPRVILHNSIIKLGGKSKARHHTSETEVKYIEEIVSKDADGMYYIDFFEKAMNEFDDPHYEFPAYLQKISELIIEGLKSNSPSIHVKYQWLKEKYNKVVQSYQKSDIQWTDPDIKKAYEELPML